MENWIALNITVVIWTTYFSEKELFEIEMFLTLNQFLR